MNDKQKNGMSPIIDCDVHHGDLADLSALYPYLPRHYVEYIEDFGPLLPGLGYTNVPPAANATRHDLWENTSINPATEPEGYNGRPHKNWQQRRRTAGNPANQPEVYIKRHLDAYNIGLAVLTGSAEPSAAAVHPDADYGHALCRAHNDWTLDHWLSQDSRFRSSIHIAPQDPALAVQEIERLGPRPEFIQVLMPAGARLPFGNRFYHPIYAACQELGLPMCVHFGSEGAGISAPPTGAGYPSYYLEMRMARPQTAMAHLASLICEGVFEKFPDFRFLFIEHDFFWVPGMLWHMDSDWKALRDYTPWVKKLPSEYVRNHVRFGSQPMPDVPSRKDLARFLEWLRADEVLVYTSDFPHWDMDEPSTFLRGHDPDLRRRVMVETARELYQLDSQLTSAPRENAARAL